MEIFNISANRNEFPGWYILCIVFNAVVAINSTVVECTVVLYLHTASVQDKVKLINKTEVFS